MSFYFHNKSSYIINIYRDKLLKIREFFLLQLKIRFLIYKLI